MSYDYQTERASLFSATGVATLLLVRDNVKLLLKASGAFMAGKAFTNCSGGVWTMLACLDYLVETGEIVELPQPGSWAQHRVFIAATSLD